ncbi:pentapeptide repeat-containing protein [Ascidiimonas sp. W6]|uniref:pentapeptide repeat-containing protein n=1 Tax=Ascidiimonas meishanensis TaxID=3128903 RepID=UPI0030EE56A7
MELPFIEDQNFEGVHFLETPLKATDYENCNFSNCNFSGVDLKKITFMDCVFNECDFSEANLKDTGLKTVLFENCKLMGLRFDLCDPFLLAFSFKDCLLQYASFYLLKIKGTSFVNCNLEKADFTAAILNKASFSNCNLNEAVFESTNLQKADFRTAFNFSMDPEKNNLKGTRFSKNNLSGLLERYQLTIE